ncbi:MAG: hypothetical protein JSY10_08170 [Paenibacillus sp.]|nr:hypothetical protein [Paenibacillus sp.]
MTSVAAAASNKNITYNVISLVPNNQTLGVIVDDSFYPLTSTSDVSTLLRYDEAPTSTSEYKYVFAQSDNNQIIETEKFSRTINENETKLNKCYGRAWNSYDKIKKLPTILPPLPIINRIESDLHIENEISTIHLLGN